jgi:hypothetical protein
MQKLYKIPALMVFTGMLFFSCGNESKTDMTKTADTLEKAVDTVQVSAPSPEQLIEEQKQKLLNSSNAKMNDIYDWLKQFEEVRSNSIDNNEDGTKSLEEAEKFYKTVYKNGVILEQNVFHEGAHYGLFLPLLTVKEAKKLVDRLCRNMGGCLSPDEMDVKYKKMKDGVKVDWGGGC